MTKVIGEGHNGGVSEAVWWKHYQAFEAHAKKKANLDNDKKKIIKAAKDDGIDPEDFKDINKVRAQAFNDFIDKHNRMVRMMQFVRHPAAPFMQMIDPSLSDETGLTDEQRQEKWENIGYVAGRSSSVRDLPAVMEGHDPNSDTGRWITAGYERGQAENAKGIKAPKKAPEPATEQKPVDQTQQQADAAQQQVDSGPKDEPEVAAAKARGKRGGVTYWHNEELKKVYEVGVSDADPEGAKPITKKEFVALGEKYAAEEKQNWEDSAPATEVDDGFDNTPPDPEA